MGPDLTNSFKGGSMGRVARLFVTVSLILFTVLLFEGQPVVAEGKPGSFKRGNMWPLGGEGGWDSGVW